MTSTHAACLQLLQQRLQIFAKSPCRRRGLSMDFIVVLRLYELMQ